MIYISLKKNGVLLYIIMVVSMCTLCWIDFYKKSFTTHKYDKSFICEEQEVKTINQFLFQGKLAYPFSQRIRPNCERERETAFSLSPSSKCHVIFPKPTRISVTRPNELEHDEDLKIYPNQLEINGFSFLLIRWAISDVRVIRKT